LGTVGTVALRPAAVVNVEVNTKDASRIPVGAAPVFLLSAILLSELWSNQAAARLTDSTSLP